MSRFFSLTSRCFSLTREADLIATSTEVNSLSILGTRPGIVERHEQREVSQRAALNPVGELRSCGTEP